MPSLYPTTPGGAVLLHTSVSRRVRSYAILALVAVILALVPCVLWQDFVTPYPYWAVERAPGRIVLVATPDAPLPSGYLAGEIMAFKVLVAPTVVPSFAGIWRPEYTRLVFPDGIVTEAVAMLQPSELALQYVRLAVPCWLSLGILVLELALVTRRILDRRSPTRRTSAAA